MTPTTTDAAGMPRIYRGRPWVRVLLWVLFAPFEFGCFADLVLGIGEPFVRGLMAGYGVLVPLAVYWLVFYPRLEVSAAGVRARRFARTVETAWPNVAAAQLVHGEEGLITRKSLPGAGAARMALFGLLNFTGVSAYGHQTRLLIAERRFVPLRPFRRHLRHGDLAATVDQYAPQLGFSELLAAASLPKPPLTTDQKRKLWVAALLFAGTVTTVFVLASFNSPKIDHAVADGWIVFFVGSGLCSFWGAWEAFRKKAVLSGTFLIFTGLVMICSALSALGQMLD